MAYILATAAGGLTSVWDLRSNKPWCSLREPNRGRFSDLAWQPDNGLLLMTATDDDTYPGIYLWDLRSSTQTPLSKFEGHRAGVLSIDWSPHGGSRVCVCVCATCVWLFTCSLSFLRRHHVQTPTC